MHSNQLKRREFISVFGGAATLWSFAARAQQTIPAVGFLSGRSPDEAAQLVSAYREGLNDVGYSEGQNVSIEYRWAKGDNDKLADLAKDLISHQVSVIAATGGNNSTIAAKSQTKRIPIVFTSGSDPVAVGLVTSLSRPEGNVTGVSWFSSQLTAKGLGLLHQLIPRTTFVAVLVDPRNPEAASQPSDSQAAATALGQKLLVLNATTVAEIDGAFATLVAQRAEALVVAGDPFLTSRRDQIVALAAGYAVPTIGLSRIWAEAGSLITYGNDTAASYRKAGVYTGRILRGAKPADLPVDLDTKFELIINMKTAKALGIAVPTSLQLLADEVIE
jgi:putative ABC transport system substrate-binding protein